MSFPSPILETSRLFLPPISHSDLEYIYHHFSNPEVSRYLLDEDPVNHLDHAQEIVNFYMSPGGVTHNRWIIIEKTGNQPIGTCGYHKWDRRNRRSEIGYDLDPSFWRKGFTTEALQIMLHFGFEQMELHRIEALVFPENIASIRTLEKVGFHREGLLRDYFFMNGHFYNHLIFSLLPDDLQSLST